MNTHTDWYLEGDYLESCNCTTVCPCIWLNPPSEGECKLLVGWQIRKGHYGTTDLADRNVALACYADGPMHRGGWQVVLYLDQRVDPDQWLALERIFGGQEGGQPALLMGLVDQILGVHLADIRIDGEGRRRRLTVEGVAETEVEAIEGIRGGTATIDNPPLCVVPSHPAVVARSRHYRYDDAHFQWRFAGRNAFYSPFVYRP